MKAKLGIIGGTGFYELQGLEIKRQVSLETPFGRPSDKLIIGEKDGQEVMFLSRHSRGHVLIPSNINYRANIYAMKKFGVTHLVSVSTVGSFKEEIKPGSVVFVDQFFDRTKIHIQDTFFDDNIAVHVAFGDPVCPVLHSALVDIATSAGVDFTPQGIYLNIDGPAFSTRAESIIYRSWGVSVIGMTNIYEAKLSREAEIHFGTIAQVTDFDSWYGESVDVT
ncbi:MAG: MTAP family purine nucleoside phosphorylase, partial [Candidatus Marinimicrobia bacterium]|nr:MTAP family purine nucleoside phosphorylase [Candidatus Neomarinimicrobiota bacterium]